MKYDYVIRTLWGQISRLKSLQKAKINWPIPGISESRKKHIAELESAIEVLRKEET